MITVTTDGDTLTMTRDDTTISMPMDEAAFLVSQALIALGVAESSPFMKGYQLGVQDATTAAWQQAAREWKLRLEKQHRIAQIMRLN